MIHILVSLSTTSLGARRSHGRVASEAGGQLGTSCPSLFPKPWKRQMFDRQREGMREERERQAGGREREGREGGRRDAREQERRARGGLPPSGRPRSPPGPRRRVLVQLLAGSPPRDTHQLLGPITHQRKSAAYRHICEHV